MPQRNIKVEIFEIAGFKMLHVRSRPPRIEAKVIFDREDISQKLIFTIMDLSHAHGFGCTAPSFQDAEDPSMTFMIGTMMPSSKSLGRHAQRLAVCLNDVANFAREFARQLDFSVLDLTMFHGIDLDGVYPEELAAIRDQHYSGLWCDFRKAMLDNDRLEEADIIHRCEEFERLNGKDIGYVGHKLSTILEMMEKSEIRESSDMN
jgi:hypothetical protein